LVYESNPDRLEAKYGNLIPVLAKAVQELSAKVAELEAKVN
jgi:outer membrane murein-binding lipoprotein Lpp